MGRLEKEERAEECADFLTKYYIELSKQEDSSGNVFPEEYEETLIPLLLNDVIFLKPERQKFSIYVNCNDVFAWACADAEPIEESELREFMWRWSDDKLWPEKWCCIKRREMPQQPMVKILERAGLDSQKFKEEHNLRPNLYDAMNSIRTSQKRSAYLDWCKETGQDPLPFDARWWSGWKEFMGENPYWYFDEVRYYEELIEWKIENGFDDPSLLAKDAKAMSEALMLRDGSDD